MLMNFKTAGFEGPLDLLLHLIKTLEIDIYDIPMHEITEQYLLYIQTMQELELDVASEYLVMAATLLAIKSQMLLPKYNEAIDEDGMYEEGFQEDPRDELVTRLIEYRKYKEASIKLKEKEANRLLIYTKPPSDLSEYSSQVAMTNTDKTVTVYDMLGAFHKLMRRQRLQKPLHTKITREEISIEKRMEEVYEVLENASDWMNFYDLFPYTDKSNIVTTFLAILELLKRNQIFIQQMGNFDDIWLTAKGME
ncbi:segregation/condensation protein A [Bacillus andreraoultii]|uniref:segregation/condensation protein A n=1 Tax=Bacillus andreraoultii TaxID=1499685 RepID=UPI00053B5A22|nr:segregation/condensation protein A [Bacillus andreraoultii]